MTIRRASILATGLMLCWTGLTLPTASAQTAAEPAAKQPEQPKQIYDEKADAKEQIAQALAKAKKENRRVLIQWGANWCGWCQMMHKLYETNGEVRKELLYEYDVVLIDIGKWDKNMDLATGYGADLKGKGVPYLTILDADGKALANEETSPLEAEVKDGIGHDPAKVMAVLTKYQATPLDAETVLSDALTNARESNRVAFVHFGAPWCGWCHRLEDWLAQPEVAAILKKDFVEVKIDADRMTGGQQLLNRYRKSDQGGIPWFAFLTPDGKTIVTSDAPDGNVGCPWKDEEIDYFAGMLRKARVNLSDPAVDRLVQLLKAKRDATK